MARVNAPKRDGARSLSHLRLEGTTPVCLQGLRSAVRVGRDEMALDVEGRVRGRRAWKVERNFWADHRLSNRWLRALFARRRARASSTRSLSLMSSVSDGEQGRERTNAERPICMIARHEILLYFRDGFTSGNTTGEDVRLISLIEADRNQQPEAHEWSRSCSGRRIRRARASRALASVITRVFEFIAFAFGHEAGTGEGCRRANARAEARSGVGVYRLDLSAATKIDLSAWDEIRSALITGRRPA